MPVNTISRLFDVIDDPLMRFRFIVICSDSAAFLSFVKNLSVGFLLFHVVANNMVVVFHFAFELVDNSQYLLGFVSKNYYFEMRDLV